MYKNLTVQGLVFGMKAALLVTLFDSFIMVTPNAYVPSGYPLLLIAFNTIFWVLMGGLSGFSLRLFASRKGDFEDKANEYRVLFSLLPFAMIYGVLGRLFIPISL
ncbi:MAG: hypothetical protein KAJ00_06860 [Deltaproteobacteria bacterium]|nr:hypothetical protein [Deltaproteobacteria bacterium]